MAGTVMGEVGAHNIFHEASTTVVAWHGYDEVGPITYFTDPALLWLAVTVTCEIGNNNIFNGASITANGWYRCGRDRGK